MLSFPYSCANFKGHWNHARMYCDESKIYCDESKIYCGESKIYCGESKIYCDESKIYCGESQNNDLPRKWLLLHLRLTKYAE